VPSRRPVIIRGPYASEQSVVDHCNDAMLSEVDVQVRRGISCRRSRCQLQALRKLEHIFKSQVQSTRAAYIHVQITETDHCNTKMSKKKIEEKPMVMFGLENDGSVQFLNFFKTLVVRFPIVILFALFNSIFLLRLFGIRTDHNAACWPFC